MTDITPTTLPNRYSTPVTVEIGRPNQNYVYKGFSDLQMAYLWIKDYLYDYDNHIIITFEETSHRLNEEYHINGIRGYVCVGSLPDLQLTVFYGQLRI